MIRRPPVKFRLSSKSAGAAVCAALSFVFLNGCALKVMRNDKAAEMLRSTEYEQAITVKDIPTEDSTSPSGQFVRWPGPEPVASAFARAVPSAAFGKSRSKLSAKAAKSSVGKLVLPTELLTPSAAAAAAMEKMVGTSSKHEPAIEDGAGFNGRRPIKDPFRVGEKVTLEVSYFSVVAGDMTVETRGFSEVNGRKSYHFAGTAKSTSVFAMFYAIEDWFETYVDFETLVPVSYALHVKESKQLREVRTLFDWVEHKARYFDKKINEEQKLEEKNEDWGIPSFAQNVFSAAYYLRTFDLKPGLKTQFHVAHEGKNLVATAEVVRRERISTAAGDFNTVVVKPTISLDGKFTPMGDVFIWLTDDDRKFIVRIESKIKIGKVVGVAKAIDLGKP